MRLEIKSRQYDPANQIYICRVLAHVDPTTIHTVTVRADIHDTDQQIFALARNVILHGDQNYTPSQSSLSDFTQP